MTFDNILSAGKTNVGGKIIFFLELKIGKNLLRPTKAEGIYQGENILKKEMRI